MPKRRRQPVASDRRFRRSKASGPDHGTFERWQHSGRTLELTEQAGVLAARATEEHIIDRLVLRRLLSPSAREAAFKFKLDYQRAALEARLTGRYNPASSARDFFAGIYERSDFEEAAYQRWRNAVRELGIRLAGLVISVVCHDILPRPGDLAQLQKGLEKLVDWYGLPEDETPAAPSGKNIDQTAARQITVRPHGFNGRQQ